MADWNETIQSMNKTDELMAEITRLRIAEERFSIMADDYTALCKEAACLREENTRLRAALAGSKGACIYCSLPAEEWAKCKSGFPGCARADDAMGCPELGASMENERLRALVAEAEKVIKPFAEEAVRYAPDEGDGDDILWNAEGWLRIKHLRAAAQWMEKAALEGKTNG